MEKNWFTVFGKTVNLFLSNKQALCLYLNEKNKTKTLELRFFLLLPYCARPVKFVILEEKTASISSGTANFFSNSPSLCLATPLHLKYLFSSNKSSFLLILPWNSGQYSGSVLGYLIKSQYAPLSLASTSGNDFAQGRLCACVRAWCVLLEMNCFCLFLIDCGTGLHIHHGASHTASSPAATLMNQKLWLEDSKAC